MACGQQTQESRSVSSNNQSEFELETSKEEILFHAYLTDHELAQHFEVPIFIVIENNSDQRVQIKEDDFTVWMMESDRKVGQKAVNYDYDKSVTVDPHSEGYLASFFSKPSDEVEKENLTPQDLELEYRGELTNAQLRMDVEHLPEQYAIDSEQLMAKVTNDTYEDDSIVSEEPQSINGFIPEDRFRVTLYKLEEHNGRTVRGFIRVENLTDEEQIFDAEEVTIFDEVEEYHLANVQDIAYDPIMTIPPHGKVDYSDLFHLENEYDESVEQIIAQIYGILYKDDQFFEVIDVYGDYVGEIPSDFQWDN